MAKNRDGNREKLVRWLKIEMGPQGEVGDVAKNRDDMWWEKLVRWLKIEMTHVRGPGRSW